MKDFKNFQAYKKTKKNYKPIKKAFFTLMLTLIVLLFLSFAFYRFYMFIANSHKYTLKYVYVKGNHILSTNYIVHSIKLKNDSTLNHELVGKVYSNLEKNPWIKKVSIATLKPDTLYIDIKEKIPSCVIEIGDKQLVFDNKGKYMLDYKNNPQINLNTRNIIHIKLGTLSPQINNPKIVLNLLNLYKKLDKFEKISYIDIDGENFDVYLVNGVMVKANTTDCDEDKAIERLKSVWATLIPNAQKIESVSICYPDRIVIKWNKEINSGK